MCDWGSDLGSSALAMYPEGPYTPPDIDGTMVTFPSTVGGGNWSGFSYDPTRGLAFTSVMNIGQVAKMVQGTSRGSTIPTWVRRSPWGGAVGRFVGPAKSRPRQRQTGEQQKRTHRKPPMSGDTRERDGTGWSDDCCGRVQPTNRSECH